MILLLLVFWLRRAKTIDIVVLEVQDVSKPDSTELRFRYVCGYAEGVPPLGETRPTEIRAEVGEVLVVSRAG